MKIYTWWTWCGKCTKCRDEDKVYATTSIENPTRDERREMFMTQHGYEIHPARCPKCIGVKL